MLIPEKQYGGKSETRLQDAWIVWIEVADGTLCRADRPTRPDRNNSGRCKEPGMVLRVGRTQAADKISARLLRLKLGEMRHETGCGVGESVRARLLSS